MASGGFGAEMFILEARGDHEAADVAFAVIDGWSTDGGGPRNWAVPLAAAALVRRGDFAGARRILDRLRVTEAMFLDRELEARCLLIAEEGTWDEADAVIDRARRHAAAGRLEALPLHADRLEGLALLAGGGPEAALAPLARSVAGFAGLGATWQVALSELAAGEALAALGRDGDARSALTRAAGVFERLRVPRELARARALLDALPSA
jgi:hypothetical protein